MSPIAILLALSVAGTFIGLVYAFVHHIWWQSDETIRIKRALKKARLVTIDKAREGELVKLAGRIAHLEAPSTRSLSGRECACYQVIAYLSNDDWDRLREARGVDFILADETGRARVDCRELRVSVPDEAYEASSVHEPTKEAEAFFDRHRLSAAEILSERTVEYREWSRSVGQEITVIGYVSLETDPEPVQRGVDYRSAPKRVVISAPAGEFVIVTEEPSVSKGRPD